MIRLRAALFVASASLATGGCVAAAIPVVAGGVVARDQLRGRGAARAAKRPAPKAASPAAAPEPGTPLEPGEAVTLTRLTRLPAPAATGEDAAMGLQAYQALWSYLSDAAGKRRRGETLRSVVLDSGATLAAPRYATCGDKPLAVLIDLDENPAKAIDKDARWRRWHGDARDALVAVPGAVEGVEAARREGIAVVFTTARTPDSAPEVVAALDRLGFGRLDPDRTLLLRGGDAADATRRKVAAAHCVVALVGDALADFSDLFPATDDGQAPVAVTGSMITPLWGNGWFLLPNPVRSTAVSTNNPVGGD